MSLATDDANPLLRMELAIPFDRIEARHVEPAIDGLLADARARMQAVIDEPGPRTYENTMAALERITTHLWHAMEIVSHLESVASTPALRTAYNAIQPKVSEFASSIPLSAGLWSALQAFAATDEARALEPTRARFLEKTLQDFRRHGAELGATDKARLSAIDVELTTLTSRFAQHLLDATAAFELVIEDEARLAGLPPSAVAAARADAQARDLAGWRFTLHAPSLLPLLTYLDDAALREQVWRAYNRRATDDAHDNRGLIGQILALRREKATLLGFQSFADLVLEDRMAGSGARAREFLDDLRARVEPHFLRERAELEAFRRELDGADAPALAPWDVAYYAEKQRRALHDYDEEALRPYFPINHVLEGMFTIVARLYGVAVRPVEGFRAWDPAVGAYEVVDGDDGRRLGVFYADLYPRDNKRGGAWMNNLLTGEPDGDVLSPHLGLICTNATPSLGDAPALLTHTEVTILFHEFGHLMHHMLSEVEVRSLAGTNVAWDFVELPSQIMENWCWERDALDLFARHHETGAPLPEALLERMTSARNHRSASRSMRQLGFASLDLALHVDYDPARDGDVMAFARAHAAPFSATPLPDDYAMLAGFSHLFASPVGYAAGYYSYKWAEVLDADAFTRFREAGVFDRETGEAFRRAILARGDSRDPAELFREFMGRDPDPEALLIREGLADLSPAL